MSCKFAVDRGAPMNQYRLPPFGGPGALGPPTTGVDQASKVIFRLIAGLLLGIPALIFTVFVIASIAAK